MAFVLVACVALVGFWEVMSNRGRRPMDVFEVTAADFDGFTPRSPRWQAEHVPVGNDRAEPNILAIKLAPSPAALAVAGSDGRPPWVAGSAVTVRLVHGYNMRDCMRLKGYTVERVSGLDGGRAAEAGSLALDDVIQVWRLTSETGDTAVWTTSMMRAGDFGAAAVDVRSMPFPRVSPSGNPDWVPEGLTWRSLRHPWRNLGQYLRIKWNNSRCDPMTFLGLRRPAWASDELLTVVAAWRGRSVGRDDEPAVTGHVLEAHRFFVAELQAWRASHPAGERP